MYVWTTEDREHLAVVTLGAFALPSRSELVRRITENYVPAATYRGAVDALREIVAADPVDMALDPTWAARVARESLEQIGVELVEEMSAEEFLGPERDASAQ